MQISEFSAWLRTQTNKHKRPYQEETIRGYAETARALDLWMGEEDIDGDFTACSYRSTDEGVLPLAGRRFDAVLDPGGQIPAHVLRTARATAGMAPFYAFISTTAV